MPPEQLVAARDGQRAVAATRLGPDRPDRVVRRARQTRVLSGLVAQTLGSGPVYVVVVIVEFAFFRVRSSVRDLAVRRRGRHAFGKYGRVAARRVAAEKMKRHVGPQGQRGGGGWAPVRLEPWQRCAVARVVIVRRGAVWEVIGRAEDVRAVIGRAGDVWEVIGCAGGVWEVIGRAGGVRADVDCAGGVRAGIDFAGGVRAGIGRRGIISTALGRGNRRHEYRRSAVRQSRLDFPEKVPQQCSAR